MQGHAAFAASLCARAASVCLSAVLLLPTSCHLRVLRWLVQVRLVGGWRDVATYMREERLQPSLLFYERAAA